jgi:hypothetical protein
MRATSERQSRPIRLAIQRLTGGSRWIARNISRCSVSRTGPASTVWRIARSELRTERKP